MPRHYGFGFDAWETACPSAEAVDAVNGAAYDKGYDSDAVLLKGQPLTAQNDVGEIRNKAVDGGDLGAVGY